MPLEYNNSKGIYYIQYIVWKEVVCLYLYMICLLKVIEVLIH